MKSTSHNLYLDTSYELLINSY